MASGTVNDTCMPPGNLLDLPPSKYKSRVFRSLRKSRSRDNNCGEDNNEESDLDVLGEDTGAFEFRIGRNSDAMLPADVLFSDGKLLPLKVPTIGRASSSVSEPPCVQVRLPGTPKLKSRNGNSAGLLKSPRRSSRWKELLGLKKLYQTRINVEDDMVKTTPSPPLDGSGIRRKSVKKILRRRCSKSPAESSIDNDSLSFPLLTKGYDSERALITSRVSSSSSGGDEIEGIVSRLSLDSQKPAGVSRTPAQCINNRRKVRFIVRRGISTTSKIPAATGAAARVGRRAFDASAIDGFSPDSPRMNPSGKVVFHSGLARSSSSPGSFSDEPPRYKHRGVTMVRSYSANIPVTPVLNVPVCSPLRGSCKTGSFGFPLFSSSPQKEAAGRSGGRNKDCLASSRQHNTVVKTRRQG